jgi:hypothetical protein
MADYYWKSGWHPKIDAQVVGEELARLEIGGAVTAPRFVDAARDEKSPLHPAFCWDDGIAGELYRLTQARSILHSVTVKREGDTQPRQVYYNIITEDDRAYYTADAIVDQEELYAALLAEAMRSAQAWQARYRELKGLTAISLAIDQVRLELAAV